MRPEKALEIVRNYTGRRGRRLQRTPTFLPPVIQYPRPFSQPWTWATATANQRACFVRRNRELGIMDWDLLELFDLTKQGLSAIVAGKDWHPSYQRS